MWEKKLRLMSACGTLLYQTVYLVGGIVSTNENKIVVSPNCWFNSDYISLLIGKMGLRFWFNKHAHERKSTHGK